jgi:hypothetical protein
MHHQQSVRKQRANQQRARLQSIKLRKLAPLFFALMLGATPLLAQPDATETTEAAPAATDGTAAAKPAATPAPPANSAPAQKSKSTGNSSPFDYRSSEEISEDVPVSFPVDI